MMTPTQFPHLTDTESVRQEAAQQYGGLNDAAAFQQAHRASMDPNVSAAALRHRNSDETAKVQNDLSLAQEKIDAEYGEGYRVIDAAVRGDALSVVAEDAYGRPTHLVVGWTDKWRSISPTGPDAEARTNAQAEAAKGRLGAEARAEVQRMVGEATATILAKVGSLLGDRMGEVTQARDEALSSVLDDRTDEDRAAENAGMRVPTRSSSDRGSGSGSGPVTPASPSSTEGNDTSETGAGKTVGTETKTTGSPDTGGSGDGGGEAKWPRRHDDLDAIAVREGVVFDSDDKIDEKIAKLEAAGAKPPSED